MGSAPHKAPSRKKTFTLQCLSSPWVSAFVSLSLSCWEERRLKQVTKYHCCSSIPAGNLSHLLPSHPPVGSGRESENDNIHNCSPPTDWGPLNSSQWLLANSPQFIHWAWYSMLWISLASWGQLFWPCYLTTSCSSSHWRSRAQQTEKSFA